MIPWWVAVIAMFCCGIIAVVLYACCVMSGKGDRP